jgi:hypothetical protein
MDLKKAPEAEKAGINRITEPNISTRQCTFTNDHPGVGKS